MPTSALNTYSIQGLKPLHRGPPARSIAVRLAASQTLASGTVMGEVDASRGTYAATDLTLVADPSVQPTGTESDTGGALTAATYHVKYSFVTANGGETLPSAASAGITVGGGITTGSISTGAVTPPAGCTVNWYANSGAGAYHLITNNNGSSVTITAVGSGAAPPSVSTAIAQVNGAQTAKGLLAYPASVDGSGNITGLGDHGLVRPTAVIYISGTFSTADLNIIGVTGVTAAVITALGGLLLEGTVSAGVMQF